MSAPLAQRAALAAIIMALLLMALKAWAALETNSVSMLGSLLDSLLDAVASGVTLVGIRMAAQPADEDHRFGHGKAEALAALFQVAIITASAIGILIRAVRAFVGHGPVENAELGIGASLVAVVATAALVAYQRHIIRQTGSIAIGADSVHYSADLLLNIAVIAGLALERFAGLHGADPLFGIAIAGWLFYGAFRASEHAINELMDKEWPDKQRAAFVEVAARQPGIKGIHDFRTRRSGAHDFAQFHMEVDPQITVAAAHRIVEAVEGALRRAFPKVEVLIHLDPEGHIDTDNPLVEEDVTPHWFRKRI